MSRPARPLADRFWEKVDRSAGPRDCWPWMGTIDRNGYGRFFVSRQRPGQKAHRVAYELAHGPIPEGREIDHVKERGCTRRDCCNPAHLEPVTHRENGLRGTSFAAVHAAKTHCPRGHEYTAENTYIWRAKNHVQRACRTCKRVQRNARHQREMAAARGGAA